MIIFPPCKINLGLHVLKKRDDGYHEIETCIYPIPLFDILEIVPSEIFSFTSSGLSIPGELSSNLCVKAFELIQSNYSIPNVKIHLHKQIPMGGGLGGGSSDGSYVLRGLNDLFQLQLTDETLQQLASELGSDCPFFICNEVQLATGRGEILEKFPFDLNGYFIKIINIGIHISTKEAYGNVKMNTNPFKIKEILMEYRLVDFKNQLTNSFETSVFKEYPELEELKNKLYEDGAIYASMTGSGSTMYGIYKEEPQKTSENKDVLFELVIPL
jgi:4-diphosphocytidyl-2-C-methyl-D-erythritol kinase